MPHQIPGNSTVCNRYSSGSSAEKKKSIRKI